MTKLKSEGLDPSKFKMTTKEVTKDDLLEDYAVLWFEVQRLKTSIKTPKRIIKIYEKALTNPIFPEDKFPLKDNIEILLFHNLQLLQDRTLALVELMYQELEEKKKKGSK